MNDKKFLIVNLLFYKIRMRNETFNKTHLLRTQYTLRTFSKNIHFLSGYTIILKAYLPH